MIDLKPIEDAVESFNAEWIKENGDGLFGMCGYGYVEIKFGRKIKLRKQFQDAGLIKERLSYRKTYGFNRIDVDNDLRIQNYNYNTSRSYVIVNELNKQLEQYGLESENHTWID
jgi:hypothetical protein